MKLPLFRAQSFSAPAFFAILVTMLVSLLSIGAQASRQLTCTPCALHFGTVPVGQSETQFLTLTNTGSTSVTVTSLTLKSEFSVPQMSLPFTLFAGESVSLGVVFTPTVTGWTGGEFGFTSNASNPTLLFLLGGTGVISDVLTANPSNVSFGQAAVGSSSAKTVVLTNNRPRTITISSFNTTGTGFSFSGPATPFTLNPGQSVTVNVTFNPQAAGVASGSVFITGPELNVPFSGTGTLSGQLTINPAPLNFGSVPVGSTKMQPITVAASGASVTVSSDSVSNSQFALTGASFPLTIAAGQAVSLNVAFTPGSSGTQSGMLSIASNASNPQTSVSLTGNATTVAHSVNLWWNAVSGVAGYNLYRSIGSSGSFSKINSTLDANTAYTDSTVVSGQTYYYEATSVNSAGMESAPSSPLQTVIP
jgi:hypothetical protein